MFIRVNIDIYSIKSCSKWLQYVAAMFAGRPEISIACRDGAESQRNAGNETYSGRNLTKHGKVKAITRLI